MVPATEVLFRPHVAGGEYQDLAVIDSGSELTLVPYGTSDKHGWPRGRVDPHPVGGTTGRASLPGFRVEIRIGQHRFDDVVYEMTSDAGIKCPLIGLQALSELMVLLEGRTSRLTLSV